MRRRGEPVGEGGGAVLMGWARGEVGGRLNMRRHAYKDGNPDGKRYILNDITLFFAADEDWHGTPEMLLPPPFPRTLEIQSESKASQANRSLRPAIRRTVPRRRWIADAER